MKQKRTKGNCLNFTNFVMAALFDQSDRWQAKKKVMVLSRIELEQTRVTPAVLLEEGLINIKGRSITENAGDFYRPIKQWVADYVAESREETRVILAFEYINTSSTKWVYSIITELAAFPDVHEKVKIEWHYEKGDDELYELGKIIHTFINCPFLFYETEQA